jgi:iron complex transport system substrate-binding protein
MEVIVEKDPDYIFVTTMGSDTDAALNSVQTLLIDNPAWNTLTAVKEGHYSVLPKNMFQNKPNQRWGKSYEMLADILYPEN